jgi:hypothetical protein
MKLKSIAFLVLQKAILTQPYFFAKMSIFLHNKTAMGNSGFGLQ